MSSVESANFSLESITEKLSRAQKAIQRMEDVEAKFNSLRSLKPTPMDIEDLVALDRANQHVLWLHAISKIMDKFKANPEDVDNVASCHRLLVSLVEQLCPTKCRHLKSYAVNSLIFMRKIVLPNLERRFEAELEALNYPKCVLGLDSENESSSLVRTQAEMQKFQKTYLNLNSLRLPELCSALMPPEAGNGNTDPAMLVLRPLKKRFKYHFCGTKKTNNPVKPEWYMQQTSGWLKHSRNFFEIVVRPVMVDQDDDDHFGRFASNLARLVVKKLQKDVAEAMFDDVTLSHMIDEVLTFSQQFAMFGVNDENLPNNILLDATIANRWLALERKFAFAKIDDMMLEEGSWSASNSKSDVSKCAETFVALLQSITHRFRDLTIDVDLQLRFVRLQCDLLEDMRLRLAQIVRQEQSFPLSEKFCLILNSSHHLSQVIQGWSTLPIYLRLQLEAESLADSATHPDLFREAIDGLDFLVRDLVKTLADHIYYEVKSRSKPYKDKKWFAYTDENVGDDPCDESLPMLQILASGVEYATKQLNGRLTSSVVDHLADRLSDFFIVEIILASRFSAAGCRQISVDMTKGVIVILGSRWFAAGKSGAQLREVCSLLCEKQANAILLLDSLSDPATDSAGVLKDVSLHTLTAEQAVKILRQRVDINLE